MVENNRSTPVTPDKHDSEKPSSKNAWDQINPRVKKYIRRTAITVIAIVSAILVSFVSIDLGPVVRAQAERLASERIDRPVHIGRLGAYLMPGHFLIEDLVIEGLSPQDEPFFTADRVVVTTSWGALLGGEILVDGADMGQWRMLVELFPDGTHSFPRFTAQRTDDNSASEEQKNNPDDGEENNQRYIVTTIKHMLAHDGEFVYRDYGAPWSVVARNINLTIEKQEDRYGGDVSFRDGTVQIGSFLPMTADLNGTYELDGGLVNLTRIGLKMDGFVSELTGEVDLLNWPEQTYRILESSIELPPMKEVFFAEDNFAVTGEASFTGEWHLFDGGRELTGNFESDDATLNDFKFPGINGALLWTRDRFEVFETQSYFYGGNLDIEYSMKPLGLKVPGTATLNVGYQGIDVSLVMDDALNVRQAARPEGFATGQNELWWPLGQFGELTGEGVLSLIPKIDIHLTTESELKSSEFNKTTDSYADAHFSVESGPWSFPIGGTVSYTVFPNFIEILPSRLATPRTQITFEGRTAYGGESRIPFQVGSSDWQESDRLMASVLTTVGSPMEEFTIGGNGNIDGVMTGTFTSPRIQGKFQGEDLYAWNVLWGSGQGNVLLENNYIDVVAGHFDDGTARLEVNGRFALGARTDGADEIRSTFNLSSIPSERLRHAFSLDGYNIEGPLTGEISLFGKYRQPFGQGHLTLTEPLAYGEPFDSASARLRFEGDGVRLDALEVHKGRGIVRGAAYIQWDETYSFNADVKDLSVSSIDAARIANLPLAGLAQLTAEGAGSFGNPRYEVRGTVNNLSVSGETVGQVSGRVNVRDGLMAFEAEAASQQLAVSGSGRVNLSNIDSELLFRFTNTKIDPYVRAFYPELSADLNAEVSGTLQVFGALTAIDQLQVVSTVEQFDFGFFDYTLTNKEPIRFVLDNAVVGVEQMQLIGEEASLALSGNIGLETEALDLQASGDVGLTLLQVFFPDVRSAGQTRLMAKVGGTTSNPFIRGEVGVRGGRIRHLSFPHGIENLEGPIIFEQNEISFDNLAGSLGGGNVRFGGRVGLNGYSFSEFNMTATGEQMSLRFPEGARSVVDAALELGGGTDAPILSGTVLVKDAVLLDLFQSGSGFLGVSSEEETSVSRILESELPLRLDVRINAPSSIRISDNLVRATSSAELVLGGTYNQPLLYGNAEIERGEVFFEGNRYRVTRGRLGFSNPTAIEPFFDVEAETDVRAPGQTYRVTLNAVGTMDQLAFELNSDPPLPEFEIMSLLMGNIRDPQAAELRSLRAQDESRQELFGTGAARLLTNPLSSGVGRVVQESFGVDTFQISPSLADPSTQQSTQLLPTARLLIGKRISDRAHVTLSRTLTGANQDIIVVLEYDQNERLSWILSQNEDNTYALDFRMRHAF